MHFQVPRPPRLRSPLHHLPSPTGCCRAFTIPRLFQWARRDYHYCAPLCLAPSPAASGSCSFRPLVASSPRVASAAPSPISVVPSTLPEPLVAAAAAASSFSAVAAAPLLHPTPSSTATLLGRLWRRCRTRPSSAPCWTPGSRLWSGPGSRTPSTSTHAVPLVPLAVAFAWILSPLSAPRRQRRYHSHLSGRPTVLSPGLLPLRRCVLLPSLGHLPLSPALGHFSILVTVCTGRWVAGRPLVASHAYAGGCR
jgi:hypothetical protein